MPSCAQMPFTHSAYRNMLQILKERGYGFCGYGDWGGVGKPVILRHDIDFDPIAALAMAELESSEGVRSTYFVLLRTDFYNPLERGNVERLREIARLGHDIGLHYDETQYEDGDDAIAAIQREADTLGGALGLPIECVSMHRPSKASLEAQWSIPGIVNSYSSEFFQGFEYASDSRRRWRKPILDMIESGKYPRLHVLTHPFWYGGTEASLEESLRRFIERAGADRLGSLDRNFTGLDSVLGSADVLSARLASLRNERFGTERLVLRPLRLEDAADMFEYTSDPEISRFLNWAPHGEPGEARDWIASKLARPEPDDLLLGIELREPRKLIGTVRAYRFDAAACSCEVSYALNSAFQGCGYMREALGKLADICFDEVRVGRIVARIDEENAASAHVARRLGMKRVRDGDFVVPIKGEERIQHTYVLGRRP